MIIIPIPAYLLNDEDLSTLIARAEEIMLELAGEEDVSDLGFLIAHLRDTLSRRLAGDHNAGISNN